MLRPRISKLKGVGIVLPACLLMAGVIAVSQCGTRRNDSTETVRSALTMGSANVASQAAGAIAEASSTHSSPYAAGRANNGDRTGMNWGTGGNGGGWNDGTADAFPDYLTITFARPYTIDKVDVISVQDNYTNPSTPTPLMTFTLYGLTAFEVQYWNIATSTWVTVPGGAITGNNLVWKRVTFPALTTSKIRIWVNGALNTWSRIVEVEAYTALTETSANWWKLARSDGGTINGPSLAAATGVTGRSLLFTTSSPGTLDLYRTRSNIELDSAGGVSIATGAPDVTTLAAAQEGPRTDIFWRLADKTVATKQWTGASFITPSSAPPLGFFAAGVGAAGTTNRVDIFGVGTDHNLYQAYRIGTSWSGWFSIPTPAGGLASLQPAVVWTPSALWVFAVASDRTLRYTRHNGSTWEPWISLGGQVDSGVAATIVGNRIDVFVAGAGTIAWKSSADGGVTWSPTLNGAYLDIAPAINVAAVTIDGISRKVAPTAIARGEGAIDVFARDVNGAIQLMTIRPTSMLSGSASQPSERAIPPGACQVWGENGENTAAATLCGSTPYHFLSYGGFGLLRIPESDFFSDMPSNCTLPSGPQRPAANPFEIRFPGDPRFGQSGIDVPVPASPNYTLLGLSPDNQIVRLSDNSIISLRHAFVCSTVAGCKRETASPSCPSTVEQGIDLIYRSAPSDCGSSTPTWSFRGSIDKCQLIGSYDSDRPEMAAHGMNLFVIENGSFYYGLPTTNPPHWNKHMFLWISTNQGQSWEEWNLTKSETTRMPFSGMAQITTVGSNVVMFTPQAKLWVQSTDTLENPTPTQLSFPDYFSFTFDECPHDSNGNPMVGAPCRPGAGQESLSMALASSSTESGNYVRVGYTTRAGFPPIQPQNYKTGLVRINSDRSATVLPDSFRTIIASTSGGSILYPTLIEADRVTGPANGNERPPVLLFWVETTQTPPDGTWGCFRWKYCQWGNISVKATVFRGAAQSPVYTISTTNSTAWQGNGDYVHGSSRYAGVDRYFMHWFDDKDDNPSSPPSVQSNKKRMLMGRLIDVSR